MASSHGVLPRVIGHRGAAGWAPENTLASIRKAKELGVAWVEVDVMLTRDKVRFPSLLRARTRDDAAAGDGRIRRVARRCDDRVARKGHPLVTPVSRPVSQGPFVSPGKKYP